MAITIADLQTKLQNQKVAYSAAKTKMETAKTNVEKHKTTMQQCEINMKLIKDAISHIKALQERDILSEE